MRRSRHVPFGALPREVTARSGDKSAPTSVISSSVSLPLDWLLESYAERSTINIVAKYAHQVLVHFDSVPMYFPNLQDVPLTQAQ